MTIKGKVLGLTTTLVVIAALATSTTRATPRQPVPRLARAPRANTRPAPPGLAGLLTSAPLPFLPSPISAPSTSQTTSSPTTVAKTPLVPWTGPVEHLFFHTLVANPALAFTQDRLGQGFRDYFVTVKEFRAALDGLYDGGWSLVDLHRVVAGTVRVPRGRRPVVISEDDVNYYDYERPRGLGWRLVLDAGGAVKVEVHDTNGVRVTDDDLVPIIDEFVAQHPEFSADGAKGVLALTGYEGLFGERLQDRAAPDYQASVTRATAVAQRLKATGWLLASHTFGHIDFSTAGSRLARWDIDRWRAEADPIVGNTDILIYPFGGRPPPGSAIVPMLRERGFTILCDIDVQPRLTHVDGVTIMSRRHIDGLALDEQASRLAPFFDAARVEDRAARDL